MHPPRPSGPSARETMLTVLMLSLAFGGFLVVSVGFFGLFIVHALGIMTLVAAFGGVHYLLWGRSLSAEVAGEREEELPTTDADGWPLDGPPRN